MLRARITVIALAASAALAVSAGAASASPHAPSPQAGTVAFEADNGSSWVLSDGHGVLTSGTEEGYADTGVVVDLGPASSFTGVKATGSADLEVNVWIADGSEATVPGAHPLSSPANFDYGLGQPGGTWYMTGKPDAYSGQTLTDAQIRSDFAGDQVWAWVGISDAGTTASGYVSAVNGYPVMTDLAISAGGGKVTAYADPLWSEG